MKMEEFIDVLKRKGYSFEEKDGVLMVVHRKSVDLESLTSLPEGVQFNNGGWVDLRSLTTLPEGVQFNNGGWVDLRSLTTLPEGVEFNNGGSVDLESLTTLPEGVEFNNGGWVDLRSLKEYDANNCGNYGRDIKILPSTKYGPRVSLGCFIGTEEEAVKAIREKYGEGSDYEAKVVEAFRKFKS